MELSLFLAQILGLYTLLAGLVALIERKPLTRAVDHIISNALILRLFGLLELVAGTLLVIAHPIWTGWQLIITIFGLALIFEGILYLLLPKKQINKFVGKFLKSSWLPTLAVLSIVLGAYLTLNGFGLI